MHLTITILTPANKPLDGFPRQLNLAQAGPVFIATEETLSNKDKAHFYIEYTGKDDSFKELVLSPGDKLIVEFNP